MHQKYHNHHEPTNKKGRREEGQHLFTSSIHPPGFTSRHTSDFGAGEGEEITTTISSASRLQMVPDSLSLPPTPPPHHGHPCHPYLPSSTLPSLPPSSPDTPPSSYVTPAMPNVS
ncbi:hypothetical protein Pcinc_023620 [Petrolisthes cinctipes]|uniref:Uncharacterized protein n=1 Tax=Petrolisthes cinctipes TaxID=88211 RepID=A0AAE1FD67_PETCI|nr:hypothetical protein Pcinc_023620 [Petrolisthes cinctipes]